MWAEIIRRQGMSLVAGSFVGAILLSALIVSAGTLKGQIEGDFHVNTTGSPNFISGANGDAYVKDQLEVDGDVSVDGNIFRVNASSDVVGVGMTPVTGYYMSLSVLGGIVINYIQQQPSYAYAYASLFANCPSAPAELYVRDGNGTVSLLSSHKDPALFDPDAHSSFDDPGVAIPFSFHHSNPLIGKGAVVDLAGLVADTERRYGKSYTTVYDLPAGETDTVAGRQARLELRAKERILSESPEVEISIQEAREDAEIMEPVESTQSVTRYRYDLNTDQVIAYQVEEKVVQMVSTGRYERQLKEGVRFDETTGKFYRQRAIDEVELPPDAVPPLPDWILSRVPQQ